jgi:hypothetical protein
MPIFQNFGDGDAAGIFQILPMWPYTRPTHTPLITNINVPLVIGAASHEAQALQTPRITFGCL